MRWNIARSCFPTYPSSPWSPGRERLHRMRTSPRSRRAIISSTPPSLALKLHPDTRRIAVIDGSLQSNDDVQTEITRQLRQLSPQVGVEYWRNLALANLIERVKELPDDSLILYVRQTMRTATQPITQTESLEQVLDSRKGARLRRR